jgi:hypothetical protein
VCLTLAHFEVAQDGVVAERFNPITVGDLVGAGECFSVVDPYGTSPAYSAAASGIEGEFWIEFGLIS